MSFVIWEDGVEGMDGGSPGRVTRRYMRNAATWQRCLAMPKSSHGSTESRPTGPHSRTLRALAVESFQPGHAKVTPFRGKRSGRQSSAHVFHQNEAMPQQSGQKSQVFFAARNQFGNGQVMNFKAETRDSAGVLVVNVYQTMTPSVGEKSRINADTVGVITESLVKRRTFANRAVNQIAVRRITQGEDIGFHGDQQLVRGLGKLSENSLAADDDKLRRAGNASGGADDMLKLGSEHGESGI